MGDLPARPARRAGAGRRLPLPDLRQSAGREIAVDGLIDESGQPAIVTGEDPNGIALSPDDTVLYVSNAARERPIWMAYPLRADGTVGPGRQFAEASAWAGLGKSLPDGLKVDRQGNVFATGPAGIHVFASDGTRLGRIETGAPTGNLNWGDDGSVLYIAADDRILRLRTTTSGARSVAER